MSDPRDIDPFGDDPVPEPQPRDSEPPEPERKPEKKKKRRLSQARKITYSATAAAIAMVMMILTCYLPLTVAPLVMISLCYNVVIDRCGFGYGIMTMLVSVGLGFLCCAANVGVLLIVAVVFVPYSFVCVPLKKLDYSGLKKALVRIAVITVFAALEVLFVFLLGNLVTDYIDIAGMIESIGNFAAGYIVVTIVAVILFVCVDVLFVMLGKQAARVLK